MSLIRRPRTKRRKGGKKIRGKPENKIFWGIMEYLEFFLNSDITAVFS
jgi:hypothetical protein